MTILKPDKISESAKESHEKVIKSLNTFNEEVKKRDVTNIEVAEFLHIPVDPNHSR